MASEPVKEKEESPVTRPLPPPITEAEIDLPPREDAFPPPSPPEESVLSVVPTYVDYDGTVYTQILYPGKGSFK